jgi:photosystem II stability/assembly factor-like uncharacterized protein
MQIAPERLAGLEWRLVGPHRGGRVVAVAGVPSQPHVAYFGATGGGVWKTSDGAATWYNISDGYFQKASVGAIAVATSDPNVIYVGMGEATIRGNVSHGDGVYRSTDAGKTWQHMGLSDTRHIARIRVHPQNPELVYLAALGHAYGPNQARGVYRSTEGGKNWEQILSRGEHAGAIDLAMDSSNPRVLYTSMWEAVRTPYSLSSGGPGSGLFKSTDGGDQWTEISHYPGLPKGTLGKMGVAASPAQAGRVWVLVEAEDGGLFRSDDGGATWDRINEDAELRQRPWYYMHIFADGQDADTVWVLNMEVWRSKDGGKTFTVVRTPHGDNHDLWINPHNSRHLVEGSDGGCCVSYDGGAAWSSLENQPTAELYHVTADTQIPYRIYASQQDNTAISLPTLSMNGAISSAEWSVPGGGESGYISVRPDDPNIVYAGNYSGSLTRFDGRSGQIQDISVWPENSAGWAAESLKYRFQWTFPVLVSAHPPYVLYVTGNHVFRSADEGCSWEQISPDLTRHEPHTLQASGGPITKDNISTEYYATIFAFAESPLDPNVLWAGSDDGLVHVSKDAGQSWQNVTPADLPEWAMISIIDASPHAAGTAYMAATRYKSDDFAPYLYKTSDFGQTWTSIVDGIPNDDFTRVIREDPVRPGLLYAGTETGMYHSFDDGQHWSRFQSNLPVVPIHDLLIKDSDLIAATHGRSFWILDDISPLLQLTAEVARSRAHLFAPRPTYRYKIYRGFGNRFPEGSGKVYRKGGAHILTYYVRQGANGELVEEYPFAGKNPPNGVVVNYYLGEPPQTDVELIIRDEQGQVIQQFSSHAHETDENKPKTHTDENGKRRPRVSTTLGMNRFVWDMRYPEPTSVPGAVFWEAPMEGPTAAPGHYEVQLKIGDQTFTQPFEIRKDPRVSASDSDLDAQFALLIEIRDRVSATHDAVNTIRDIRNQMRQWEEHLGRHVDTAPAVSERITPIEMELRTIEEELLQVNAHAFEDTLNFPIKLNNKLTALAATVEQADAAPTQQAYRVFADLSAQVAPQLEKLRAVLERDIADLNHQIGELGVPPIAASHRGETTGRTSVPM